MNVRVIYKAPKRIFTWTFWNYDAKEKKRWNIFYDQITKDNWYAFAYWLSLACVGVRSLKFLLFADLLNEEQIKQKRTQLHGPAETLFKIYYVEQKLMLSNKRAYKHCRRIAFCEYILNTFRVLQILNTLFCWVLVGFSKISDTVLIPRKCLEEWNINTIYHIFLTDILQNFFKT